MEGEIPLLKAPRESEACTCRASSGSDVDSRRAKPSGIYRLESPGPNGLRTPDWAKHAVWYQVMVDRFCNGDPASNPEPARPWRSEWFAPSAWEGRDGQSFYRHFVFQRRYGGDLAGLGSKLPYLRDLGVNALYLNPVFQARSHHKYDATSHLHVDEHFGTKGDYARAEAREDLLDPSTWTWTESDLRFLAFLKAAKAHGIRVVIDGVFNHVGTAHPAFRDARAKGKASRYADWFDVRSWEPFEVAGWGGFASLPAFKKTADGLASASLKEHLFAVTRRWMDPDGDGDPGDGIDGWRLDVPSELPRPFWEEWRALVKSVNSDAYVSGEIWQRADDWLDGTSFDAVMNYPFAANALEWIANRRKRLAPSELDRRLAELRRAYPPEATYALMNLVGSHDTDRVASRMKNPDRPFAKRNRNQDGARFDETKPGPRHYRKARLLLLFQATYVGAPMVYYGDEVGMWGADDPSNRKPMLWRELEPYDSDEDRVEEEHLGYYRRALAFRRAHPALRTGTYHTLLTDDARHVFAFERAHASEALVVVLNAGRRTVELAAAELGFEEGELVCVFGTEKGSRGALRVPAFEGRIYAVSR